MLLLFALLQAYVGEYEPLQNAGLINENRAAPSLFVVMPN